MNNSYFNSCCNDCKHKEYCKAYEIKSYPCDSLNYEFSDIAKCKKDIRLCNALTIIGYFFSGIAFILSLICLVL